MKWTANCLRRKNKQRNKNNKTCFNLSPLPYFIFASALGYQLNSAECMDIRLKRVVPDHYCHYYPENKKPKPKLKECNMDPCPSRFV